MLTIRFSKSTQQDLSGALEHFAQTLTFLLSPPENTKNEPFWTF